MRTLLPGLLTLLVFSVSALNAQAGNPAGASDTTTLRQQYDDMLRVSNRYQQFRVVRQDFLNAFIDMSLLGMSLSKATYATIMWAAIIGLLALCVFAFLRMKVALSSAREARENSDKLSGDLAKAKKRRLEVEQDLGRKLQDEINKNRNR